MASPIAIVLSIGGLYVGQSIIGGVTFTALPSVLRDRGLPLDQIGLTYLAVLPWVLKFLWAPMIERYRLPPTGPSRSRSIVFVGGLITAVCFVLGRWDRSDELRVAHGGLHRGRFRSLHRGHRLRRPRGRKPVRALSRLGQCRAGGRRLSRVRHRIRAFLVLVARIDWAQAMVAMALMLVLLGLPFVLSPPITPPSARLHKPSLRDALNRSEMRKGLALSALYALSQKWGLVMLGPFLVDSGLDLDSLGIVNGVGGMIVGFGCALLGGALVRLWGARSVMVLALVLQAMALAGLATAAWTGGTSQWLLLALALASSSAILALGFVALYAQFMGLSDPRQAGIDFTLLQCMDALVSMIGGIGAGWIAQNFGYGACFGLAALLIVLAIGPVAILSRRVSAPLAGQADAQRPQPLPQHS